MSRDLLESAAKAVGMPMIGKWCSDGYELPSRDPVFAPVIWNPLADDGDALRLAVKLGLQIIHADGYVVCYAGRSVSCPQITENFESDRLTTTRRAIVRAAAEIGKQMP